jgi:hypothetical protein
MSDDILNRLKNKPAANDRVFVNGVESDILTEAKRIAAFIKASPEATKATIRKAQTKFGLLGNPESWDKAAFDRIDELIDLSIVVVAQKNLQAGIAGKDIVGGQELIKKMHQAIDETARAMPHMVSR